MEDRYGLRSHGVTRSVVPWWAFAISVLAGLPIYFLGLLVIIMGSCHHLDVDRAGMERCADTAMLNLWLFLVLGLLHIFGAIRLRARGSHFGWFTGLFGGVSAFLLSALIAQGLMQVLD